jgi:hypothetical protein
MQAISLGLVAAFMLILGLAVAFGIILAAPLLAMPFFLVGFTAFLIWRGRRRAEPHLGRKFGDRVPTTEQAAGDPVADSSVPDAARTEAEARPT